MSELTSPVIVKDVSNKLVLNFVGEANLAGKPAWLWIGTSTVDGGARSGLLVVRNGSGNDSIVVDGATGDILAGGKGQDGTLVLFDRDRPRGHLLEDGTWG